MIIGHSTSHSWKKGEGQQDAWCESVLDNEGAIGWGSMHACVCLVRETVPFRRTGKGGVTLDFGLPPIQSDKNHTNWARGLNAL